LARLLHEEILQPEPAICHPHHHLWDHPKERYLVEEMHQDTGAGHNVVTTEYVWTGFRACIGRPRSRVHGCVREMETASRYSSHKPK